ncbi:MAG: lamin tail domain-containing protein [Clostridiales bacterium]|nr:lamin tail domain-containing protein [Clostridiales bacterium]MCD8157188.1 lamin tail domain-containing protein [Clostridiales bacterium]
MKIKHRIRATLATLLLTAVTVLSALTAGFPLTVTASAATETPLNHVIINQVYGGSTDGYASHSFIELYNPTAEAVDLSGWTI